MSSDLTGTWYRVRDGTKVFVDKVDGADIHVFYYTGSYGVKKQQSRWAKTKIFLATHSRKEPSSEEAVGQQEA